MLQQPYKKITTRFVVIYPLCIEEKLLQEEDVTAKKEQNRLK